MELSFDSQSMLWQGLFVGIIFGFLLRKGHLCRFDVIVGQFLFKDFTVVKVMFTAIMVGSIGVGVMTSTGGIEDLIVKPLTLWGNLLGGLIFGVGMALLGLCPGTCVVAAGEGTRHAYWGLLGMVAGAMLYAEAYDFLKANVLDPFALGKLTLPAALGISHWWVIGAVIILGLCLFYGIEKYENKQD